MCRGSAQDKEVREHVYDVDCLEPAINPDGQALPGKLVDHVEHAELSAIVGSVLDEVVGPNMVGMLRPQPDTGSVVKPESPALGLLLWNLEPLSSPDPLHSLVVHRPAGPMQHRRDPAIAIAAILGSEGNDVGSQCRFILAGLWELALSGSMLSQNPACASLRDAELGDNVLHARTATSGAQ